MVTSKARDDRDPWFTWTARDRSGREVRGELRAADEVQARGALRRQGLAATRIQPRRRVRSASIRPRDIAVFTRQLATLMRAGVPLLQAFDIVGRGHANPAMVRLLADIRADVETGSPLSAAFRRHPGRFDRLYCNLVEAGEVAGTLDPMLERLALHLEKSEAMKSRLRSAMLYPSVVLLVALVVTAIILVVVVPSFRDVFASFGADLPAPTLAVMAASEFLIRHGWLVLLGLAAGGILLYRAWRRNAGLQSLADRLGLRLPVFGALIRKAAVARWARTLATLFSSGVPLVEALNSVGGAAGLAPYVTGTERIRRAVSTGSSLTVAMDASGLFPPMVLQMGAIGEESGKLDAMLGKAAEILEAEVDERLAGLASLLEPVVIVVLGAVIGSIVVAMYLPIFRLGQVV